MPPTETIDSGEGADTTAGDDAACACSSDSDDYESCGYEVTCELPTPCPRVAVTCPRPGGDLYDCTAELVYDGDAIRCALEVLRDDTVAQLLVDGTEDYGIYSGQERHTLYVQGGRVVSRTRCMSTDVGPEGWAMLATSADAEHFAGCLELEFPRDMYECMWAGIVDTGGAPACR
jgi:hypothetical protein